MTQPMPIPVMMDTATIKNFAEVAKPPVIKTTSLKTWILDVAGAVGPRNQQITDYEPRRLRMLIKPIDQAITVTLEPPINSPDTSSATVAPQGLHLTTTNDQGYVFMGPDAMWINSLTGTTRVVVMKEYC